MPDHVTCEGDNNPNQIQEIQDNNENINNVAGSIEILKVPRGAIELFKQDA